MQAMNTKLKAFDLLEKVRREAPVVHHLTNWVTIYDCAQIVKTLGASPVMAHAPEEVADMTRIASALVLNIGTLTVDFVEAMKTAAASANQKGIPVILDVCGAGATELRDRKVSELLDQVNINVIKGNASEIARVSGANVRTKGVDATEVGTDLEALAQTLAVRRHATVVITGKVDIVAGDQGIYRVKNGDALMTRVVGTGLHGGFRHRRLRRRGAGLPPGGGLRPGVLRNCGGTGREKITRSGVVQSRVVRLPLRSGPANR